MDVSVIFQFLKDLAANNNREWFQGHKDEYLSAKAVFEKCIEEAIARITEFDPSVKHLTIKDVTYRFYRDTRFSSDKTPYKIHLGGYINARGKKSEHCGYYVHIEPDNCMLAGGSWCLEPLLSCGSYWLPTNILTSCRNEIMTNIDTWRGIVESKKFVELFGRPGEGTWDSPKGFGLESLKTAPSGFPRDYEFIQYLRMKDYCCWTAVPDTFFSKSTWLDEMSDILVSQ